MTHTPIESINKKKHQDLVDELCLAIEFGNVEQTKEALDAGVGVGIDQDFTVNHNSVDPQLTDPLSLCCRRLNIMVSDGWSRKQIAPWLCIAHLLIDRGASLLRPDTSMDITPMEELLAMEVDFEDGLDPESLEDVAGLWARVDDNPLPENVGYGPMLARARTIIPAFNRVPGRLVEIMAAASQDRELRQTVRSVGASGPMTRL